MLSVYCDYCGKETLIYPSELQSRNFCSRNCFNSWRSQIYNPSLRIEVKCSWCGNDFRLPPERVKKANNHFCSRRCFELWLKAGYRKNPQRKTGREIACEECHKVFYLPYWRERESKHHFCSRECSNNYKRRTKVVVFCSICGQGLIRSPAMAKAKSGQYYCPKCSENRSKNPDWQKLIARVTKNKWATDLVSRETRLAHSIDNLRAIGLHPNKSELYLQELLDRYFVNEWKYVGDGKDKVAIEEFNGLVPDWKHWNGRKVILELFGDYWHSPEVIGDDWAKSELGKIMVYNSLGYHCLVIWEHELKDEQAVVAKVKQFMRKDTYPLYITHMDSGEK